MATTDIIKIILPNPYHINCLIATPLSSLYSIAIPITDNIPANVIKNLSPSG